MENHSDGAQSAALQAAQYQKMTETPISKLIISLSIPTIISMLVANIYNTADTYFVSQLGTSAAGAVGIVFSLMAIIQAFGFMCGHGAGSIISRRLGAQDAESARIIASTSFYLSLVLGLCVTVPGLIFMDPFLRFLGSTDTILPYAREYVLWILLSAPFMAASCVMNNILRYEGRAFYAMIGLTAGGILNMIGDPILMFGCGLGVTGAGMSTAISQIISFFILLYMFRSGKTVSSFHPKYITKDIRNLGQILAVGSPSLVRQGLSSVSTLLLNRGAGAYGDAAIAAMSIVGRIAFFIFAVALGIGQGFQPVSAFNYGAKKYSRVRRAVVFTALSGTILIGVGSALGILFSSGIIGLFRKDADVIAIGSAALVFQCISCFFQPISVASNMLFQSIGKSGRASFLAALRSGVFFIPLILILPKIFGIRGIEIAQPVSDILTFLVSLPFLIIFLRKLPGDGSAPPVNL